MKRFHFLSPIKIASRPSQYQRQAESGFTLIELLVVVIMIGVLASIMAPGWQTFVNRQRVNKANDAVLSALQEAQSEAKKNKLSYSVSFKTPANDVPQVAVYRQGSTPIWKNLGEDLGIKPDQVILGTNLNGENTKADQVEYASDDTSNPPKQTITFDYQGTLLNPSDADLAVVVSTPVSRGGTTPIPVLKRCVQVKTLLGAMTIGKGQFDANNNEQGCP